MQQYQLRVPFRLTHPLTQPTEFVAEWEINALRVRVTNEHSCLVIIAEPFDDAVTARAFLPRVWGALASMSASVGTGFSMDREVAELFTPTSDSRPHDLAADPGLPERVPCDAFAVGQRPSVIPLERKVRIESALPLTPTSSIGAAQFLEALSTGLRRPGIDCVFSDATLGLAIELLGRANGDSSQHSSFLTLVSALEVLFEPRPQSPVVLEQVTSFQAKVRSLRDESYPEDSIEWTALSELANSAQFLKDGSKRARVRQLALEMFSGDPEPRVRADEVVKTYDVRSTLVHTGVILPEKLSFALRIVRETVKRAIAARIERAVMSGQQTVT